MMFWDHPNELTRRRWIFDYYGAGIAAPKSDEAAI
jgi:hypothetical protein